MHYGLALKRMRALSIAVGPLNRPIQRCGASRADGEQPDAVVVAHHCATRKKMALSMNVSVVMAASSTRCCAGDVPPHIGSGTLLSPGVRVPSGLKLHPWRCSPDLIHT